MKGTIQNAVIKSTMLGVEDHGILTAYIHLDYGGAGQGFGGYSFDGPGGNGGRVAGAFGMEFVAQVLRVLGVQSWEQLPGTSCRVRAHHGGVEAIGHYLQDEWFDPKDLAESMEVSQ